MSSPKLCAKCREAYLAWLKERSREGGVRSSAKLTSKQRSARARKAAKARWGKS